MFNRPQGQGFRLDIEGDDIDDAALAAYIVRERRHVRRQPVPPLPGRRRHGRAAARPPRRPRLGIDSLNIDDTATGERPVHSTLLAVGIPIGEHLTNLEALPAAGFRFSAVPVKLRGLGTFPVRSYAVL